MMNARLAVPIVAVFCAAMSVHTARAACCGAASYSHCGCGAGVVSGDAGSDGGGAIAGGAVADGAVVTDGAGSAGYENTFTGQVFADLVNFQFHRGSSEEVFVSYFANSTGCHFSFN